LQIQLDGYIIKKALPAKTPKTKQKTIQIPSILMARKPNNPDKFKFITERSLKQEKFEITPFQSSQLRATRPKGVYWIQIVKGGLIQWNWTLLQDYLINGDCPSHRALVEEYLSTLPTTA
jgi:hypothetical protein